jgi:hypothetical protein
MYIVFAVYTTFAPILFTIGLIMIVFPALVENKKDIKAPLSLR